jgi:uncharacterized protein
MQQKKRTSSSILWLGLGAIFFGLWSQRFRFRKGHFLDAKPGKALITGASSGLGAEFARQLAARGYDLILVARRVPRLKTLAEELQKQHQVTVEVIRADLANVDDLNLVERVIRAQGQLSILVNNAGFGAPGPFAESNIERQLDMIRLHNMAIIALTREVLPGMLARHYGAVINTSSTAAFFPLFEHANYSASKAYLNSFSEAVQMEIGNQGVYIQALCPGFTVTEFHDQMEENNRSQIPRFMWMRAEDVVRQSLEALGTGEVILIPGWVNRVTAFFGRNLLTSGLAKWAAMTFLRRSAQS